MLDRQPKRRVEALFSDVDLPDETVQIRNEARAFAEDFLRPRAYALNTTPESRDGFPYEVFKAMGGAGLFGIPFPKKFGGRGLQFPLLGLLVVLEEIAYLTPGIASALYDSHVILTSKTLETSSGALSEKYLPGLIRGEIVSAFATSEPDASTDLSPRMMKTVATKTQGGWLINGRKRWITNAIAADIILVLCKSDDTRQTLFLVATKDNGITIADPDAKMGNHAQLTSDVIFRDTFVPDDHVVGMVGGGLRGALSALMLGRIGIGAVGVGMSQAAFDLACHHMENRSVFGKELARYQHWQFVFADHAIALESARALYQKAGRMFDKGVSPEAEAAMAKVTGSRLAVDIARDAIQVCGAYGFVRQLGGTGELRTLESIYRDAKIGEIYEGANEIQKWIIARRIFGRELTG